MRRRDVRRRSGPAGTARSPLPAPTSAYRPARRGGRRSCRTASSASRGLVCGARSTLDDGPCLVGARGGKEEGDVPRHVQETHRQRDRVAAGVRESPSVPAREDVLERRLDVRAEVEPPCEPLRNLAHRRERVAGSRAGVRDGLLDERGADLRGAAGPDVGPVERKHLGGVGRVDEEERGSVRDVVVVHLRRLVSVRRAPGRVEERHVVRVDELLRRCSGELAEPDGEHGGAQRVLERLARAEVGREREGADHLCGADRPLARRQPCCDCSWIVGRHLEEPTPIVAQARDRPIEPPRALHRRRATDGLA